MKIDFNKIKEALLLNELSGNKSAGLRLSWAGNTNSGISFGYHQIDTKHNSLGFKLLTNWGVTNYDLEQIKNFNSNPNSKSFNIFKKSSSCFRIEEILKKNKNEIEKLYDDSLMGYIKYFKEIGIDKLPIKDEKTLVQLIDYHNQFNLSKDGKMHKFLKEQKEIDSNLILNFKNTQLKWGQSKEGRDDIMRRFKNIDSLDYKVNIIEF